MTEQTPLTKVRLGGDALKFLRGRLGVGVVLRPGLPLRAALSQQPLDGGEVWTWAPNDAHFESSDFERGLPQDITPRDHLQLLKGFLQEYLDKPGHLVILEHHDAGSSDPFLAREPPGSTLVYQDFVYWYATNSGAVNSLLQSGLGLFNCIALTRPSRRWAGLPPVDLIADDFHYFAEAAEHFAVDAFDFEGFLLWSRAADT